jgi:hypothetical protein
MKDHDFVLTNLVVDEVRIASDGEHTNTGDVGFPPKARMAREQFDP